MTSKYFSVVQQVSWANRYQIVQNQYLLVIYWISSFSFLKWKASMQLNFKFNILTKIESLVKAGVIWYTLLLDPQEFLTKQVNKKLNKEDLINIPNKQNPILSNRCIIKKIKIVHQIKKFYCTKNKKVAAFMHPSWHLVISTFHMGTDKK